MVGFEHKERTNQLYSPFYFFTIHPHQLNLYIASMKVIGLTGGIGSGKSTVAKVFESLGICIYYADNRAKDLYVEDPILKTQVIQHFGQESYQNEKLNRKYLSDLVFQNNDKLQLLNSLVHPRVSVDFNNWLNEQNSPYIIKEAAILFESGSYVDCFKTITVCAPLEERIKRVQHRDNTTIELVKKRLDNQMSDDQRRTLADFEILNYPPHLLTQQVSEMHALLSQA